MSIKISIVGMGYVGCGNALMLARDNEVSIVDIDKEKVKNFNNKKLPIQDNFAQDFFESENLNLYATCDLFESIVDASYIILSLPTNFDEETKEFDTSILEKVITDILHKNSKALIIIKSTVNIGFTKSLRKKFETARIIFSPEFLREGHALEDNLYPSRIIIGGLSADAKLFGNILRNSSKDKKVPLLFMESTEAESVKLFSNTYLAMRVAYFNELDGFCMDNNINPSDVIKGVSLDKRIGNFYNNPSFGFGGYCLPKDSKQLLNRFTNTPHHIIHAIQDSNKARSEFIINKIINLQPRIVGIYRLAMKQGADNSRESSIFSIIEGLVSKNIKVIVFDASIQELDFNLEFIDDFSNFAEMSDLIIANRMDDMIKPYDHKIFSRDIFSSDE